jgi:hypothetical protein
MFLIAGIGLGFASVWQLSDRPVLSAIQLVCALVFLGASAAQFLGLAGSDRRS